MATKSIQYGVQIDANVRGQETVADLTSRLDDMAKVLEGELKAEAQAVAARLRELGQQQQAITAVDQLKRGVTESAAALKRAEAEAAAFGKQISLAGPPTAAEAANLQRLDKAADDARNALQGQKSALAGAVTELQRHGVAANQTQGAQQRLNSELAELRSRTAALGPAWQGTAQAANNAGAQLQRTHRAVGEGVQSISTQLQRLQGAYVALQGGGMLGGMIKDLAATADGYQSLSARIRLATGDNEAFDAAMAGVQQIAVATRSDLEATGTLFTKILEAGKPLKLSQEQALQLTQTINQAIQITGGAAGAAEAAITQLTQGLQSGVLRGDEFNSVMEQAPRLAQAMADGLGVTRGELRAMAEQGQLSAETVMRALRLQGEAIDAEFKKIPPTIAGAMQNVSTAWSVYIGEANEASGASRAAAEAINFLAENLGTVAGLLLDLGQAAAAFTALRLAQHFTGLGTSAAAAATGVAATNTALAATAANANAAAAGAGRLAGLFGTLKTFTLVGLVANIKDIGTWLGEATAKLALKVQGMQTLEEVTAEQESRQRALNAAMAEEAQWAQRQIDTAAERKAALFGLSKAAQGVSADFQKLVKDGDSVDEALGKIGKDFDLSSQPGIKDAAAVLDKLVEDGAISAEQFRAAWAKALDGRDLGQFEVMARAALEGTARGAEQLQQALDQKLREAVRRTGLDMDLIRGGMSKASVSMMNDIDTLIGGLDQLKAEGIDTATVLATRLGQGIKTADSQQALAELRTRIEEVRAALGDKVADGLLDQATAKARELAAALDGAKPGINSVAEAMKLLGVTSQQALKEAADQAREAFELIRSSGTATPREIGDAFEAYAKKAIAANNGVATEALKTEAALYRVDAAGRKAGDGIAFGMERGRKAAEKAANAMAEVLRQLGAVTDAAGNVIRNADGTSPGGVSGINGKKTELKPDGVHTQEEIDRLKKQGGPVDASYNFDVLARLNAGIAFTADELAVLQKGLSAAKNNLAASQLANTQMAGAVSFEGLQDDQRWVNVFARAVAQAQADADRQAGKDRANTAVGGAAPAAPGAVANIYLDGVATRIGLASADDAATLERVLATLTGAARRSGP